MSRTTTAKTKMRTLQRSGSILLSPSKRRRLSDEDQSKPIMNRPSENEIWEWTLTSASVAKCYIRDAMSMLESTEGLDFYWLGGIPCRKVEICGVVVGIQVFEKKVLYTVDDGTAVIDCEYTLQRPPQSKDNNKYAKPTEPLPPPRPMTRIGGVVKATGRVKRKYETRAMIVDVILSSTCGAQLVHWKTVRELHRTQYSSSEPFVIPVNEFSETPKKSRARFAEPCTSSAIVIPSQSTVASPSTIAASSPRVITSSPLKPKYEPQSPPKLRHPSRLRSQNLTDTAFRLYVKHFIDNAPEDSVGVDSDSEEDLEELYKPSRTYRSQILGTSDDRTPQPKIKKKKPEPPPLTTTTETCQGFTLSYLRRVPELSLMARRVVKQRARELDKKARESASQSTSNSSASKRPAKRVKLDRASLAAKKKRLFQWAVCELLRDGSVVLWDGPKRPCPVDDTYGNANASMLWRHSSTASTTDSTLFSNANSSTQDDDDELELSDPDPDEEAYAPTKPELLALPITEAIKALVLEPKRLVKQNELRGGSTKEEILAYLRRDDRWAFIGEWNISDALDYMEKVDLVWRPGPSGRWFLME